MQDAGRIFFTLYPLVVAFVVRISHHTRRFGAYGQNGEATGQTPWYFTSPILAIIIYSVVVTLVGGGRMAIQDVARTDVMTSHQNQSVGNIATVMKEENVGSVIIEDDHRPVGIVTDRDLVLEVLEPRRDPSEVTAADIMTKTPTTVRTDEGILEATAAMYEKGVRRLPIVDDDGGLTGIVTLDDLMVLLTDELDNLVGVIEWESPPY